MAAVVFLGGACVVDPASETSRSTTAAAGVPVRPSVPSTSATQAVTTTLPAPVGRVVVACPSGLLSSGEFDYAENATGEPTVEAAVAHDLALGINDWYPPLTVDEITPTDGGAMVTLRDDNGAITGVLWVTDLGEGRGFHVSAAEVCSPTPEPGSG